MTTDWLFRRQSDEDKSRQDAFLADIAAHWQPQTLSQRLLHRQSLVVHFIVRMFCGGPTLAPAALAAIPTGIGTGLLMYAVKTSHGALDPGPPAWDYLLLTLGFLGFAVEGSQSPRAVRPWRMSLFFGLPMALGSFVNAATAIMVVPSDQLFRVGMLVLGLGASGLCLMPVSPRARGDRLLRISMMTTGIGAAATVIADAQWAWLEAIAGNPALGWGCAADALGAGLLAVAFLHARPKIA